MYDLSKSTMYDLKIFCMFSHAQREEGYIKWLINLVQHGKKFVKASQLENYMQLPR